MGSTPSKGFRGWHLLGIIDDILTFARVEAGKEAVVKEDVDLASIVREAIALMENVVAERSLVLRAELMVAD